ncbi:hypothetical protein GOP47_0011354 [Adiantum capillus-veneris]|uniref:Senescence regulator n=1 Tax=Adiantum capillus-veneris TaxID=13818 RepID=A0A9D4USS8_ADICA|nr:hypothetical protein GOP47_0011354 [Adiantum capillus-veneris]
MLKNWTHTWPSGQGGRSYTLTWSYNNRFYEQYAVSSSPSSPSPSPSKSPQACLHLLDFLAGFAEAQGRLSMARLGGITSEALPAPPAGLASILRDHKATLGADNGRAGICRANVVEALGPQSVFASSSPESSLCEADFGADEWDEYKEEDVWATESRSCQPDLSRSLQILHGCHHQGAPSLSPRINKLNLNDPAENVGVVLGFAKVGVEVTDTLAVGVKTMKRVNGTAGEHVLVFAKKRANGEQVVRSSSRQRERGPAAFGASENAPRLHRHAELQEALATSREKPASHCSSASRMIPQAMGNQLSKVYVERQSAPVQVPDWSKILAKTNRKPVAIMDNHGEGGDKDDDYDRLPPHEILAKEYERNQMTTFSVCEGQGRTLKGRDLSRVRDAVWSQMGFAD